MKIISKTETFVVKFTKVEFEKVCHIIDSDPNIEKKFNITLLSDKSECIITQISNDSVNVLIEYFNYAFSNELLNTILRFDKVKRIVKKLKR